MSSGVLARSAIGSFKRVPVAVPSFRWVDQHHVEQAFRAGLEPESSVAVGVKPTLIAEGRESVRHSGQANHRPRFWSLTGRLVSVDTAAAIEWQHLESSRTTALFINGGGAVGQSKLSLRQGSPQRKDR